MLALRPTALALLALLAVAVPAADAATVDTASAEASAGPYVVDGSITFTSTTPCTVACRLTWTYLNGTRLGDRIGEGEQVTTSFSSTGLKIVHLRLTELCDGSTRLVCASDAYVSVEVGDVAPPSDTRPPTISAFGLTAEATGPTTRVAYTVEASDPGGTVVSKSCSPAPGSAFPVGSTPISCSAVDAHGNSASASFAVVVTDTTRPTLSVPRGVRVAATSPDGAVVRFAVAARDRATRRVRTTCTPASGSQFAIGTTTVTCFATDASGNRSRRRSFAVVVQGAPEQLARMLRQASGWRVEAVADASRTAIASLDGADRCTALAALADAIATADDPQLTAPRRRLLGREAARAIGAAGCAAG